MENASAVESTSLPASQITLSGVLGIPAIRQVVSLVGVAAAVAAGFAIVLWSQSPGFTQLYGDLAPQEASQIADALQSSGIEYKVDNNGGILVDATKLHDARLQLASQGLPQSANAGMNSIQEHSSFGVSQFMESARYQHALEAELARTIASMGPVNQARVHLALPKQSAFIRDHKNASASVMLQLYRGGGLESDQASAIVHLVASSVPNLTANDVTVIDQNGRLLSSGSGQPTEALAATQFKYARQLEETYKRRIEDLLSPLLGAGSVRAEVVADIDFTYTEETRESFDPTRTVVRSEQINEDLVYSGGATAAGVPGALSNQPPAAATTAADAEQVAASETPENTSRSSTRNYEVDRTIRHVRPQSGAIQRLSIAVLVDDGSAAAASADAGSDAVADDAAAVGGVRDEEIARYTALVKEAVGFNEERGDTVVVMSEAFLAIEQVEEAAPPAIWERPFVRDSLKQVLGAIVALAIAFGIVRPMLRGVMSGGSGVAGEYIARGEGGGAVYSGQGGGRETLPVPNYDEKVAAAKNITGHDPARVAQVVRKWVTVDG